ncbi:dynein regulatory complex subunit 3 isoform X2 [Cyclopterus lumpus]|uniref:dynein regulatory complex subunit 3 isoform X2 n=1 Tax=Cyclopterus lumpus TaxID=8103 RepID=UPI0014873CAF|nr:dynein regulatory complex subunit 3 isoform X2 [Cyclopterus lumpus]
MEKENLMDEEMLQKAIVEQAAQDQVGRVVKVEGIHFNEIPKLRLDYRNILMIDHLWEFTSLARLDLNNNLIEKIEGLDRLINLTWLNLSFNRIEKIEGLGSLRKLEVLNLSNNSISVIENMDTLEKLSHFLIANNLLGQLDNVLYLRTFKNLFTVNLYGNPVSQEDDYKLSIAAYFPKLSCLDYRLLDEKTKNEASLKYGYVLDKIKREELQRQRAEEVKQSQEAEVKLYTEAFVESLNGSHLFKSMLKDDPEALHSVPQVAHMLQTFECQMVELCMQLFETGLAEHKQRETEVNSFSGGQNEAVTHYQQKASHIFTDFEQRRKARKAELQQSSDPDLLKVNINHCKEEIHQLCNSLMALEFQLISQLEDNIKKLDINISDMIGNFSETAQGIFAQCRDLEDNYHEKVRGVIASTLEDVAKDNREKAVPDRDEMMLVDKDTVMDALATSHDNHLQMINDRETQLMTRADAWKIEEKELKRNRMRISDIHRYADHLLEQLEELQ